LAQASFHFPRGFLWGTATASHQVEGNNTNNNWWAWEQLPGHIYQAQKSGLACDWWAGRWREDFDRASDGGQNAHRLSIEWSRVQPAPDRWDESALDRYLAMLRGLAERGMTPLVTLHHFSDPVWVAEQGGWENPDIVPKFAAYVRKTVEVLKGYTNHWVTINEPNVLAASGYLFGEFPPGKRSLGTAFTVMMNMVRAHAAAYQAIHMVQPTARVGIALNVRPFMPAKSWSPLDRMAAYFLNAAFNDFFPQALTSGVMKLSAWRKQVPEARGTMDYLGINYYTRDCVAFTLSSGEGFARRSYPAYSEVSSTGFYTNDPLGLMDVLKWARPFKVPMIITENGIDDTEDTLRPRYLIQHLHQLWRAVNENYPVKGYFFWSLVDNFEWNKGWSLRFGLWELDVETQARRKRPSADLYAEICRENGLTSEIVNRYAPELVEQMFPG
jgi:beta-glucosidase